MWTSGEAGRTQATGRSRPKLHACFSIGDIIGSATSVRSSARYNLNDRQLQAIAHVKRLSQIVNSEYQQLTGATRKTAARDLDSLMELAVQRMHPLQHIYGIYFSGADNKI